MLQYENNKKYPKRVRIEDCSWLFNLGSDLELKPFIPQCRTPQEEKDLKEALEDFIDKVDKLFENHIIDI